MWQMKELFLKFAVQAVWKRRKGVYYAVSLVSIAGNLIVLVGPSILQASLVLRSAALHAARSALPQAAELVLHRSVLYILLNLIVVRIMIKSGILGRMPAKPADAAKLDELCPPSSYYFVRGLSWPTSSTYTVYGTLSAFDMSLVTESSMWLQQARGDDLNCTTLGARPQTPAKQHPSIKKSCDVEQPKCVQMLDVYAETPAQQHPSIKKSRDDDKPKSNPAPSLFTIEPLDELVQSRESYTLDDDQAHIEKTLKHPLRKVASRRGNLHRSTQARNMGTCKDSTKANERPQQKDEQSLQLVLAKHDVDGDQAKEGEEHDDNRLSRQEFNERVDTFICKFKRSLTMQRQDSLNRLLGLVGGGHQLKA